MEKLETLKYYNEILLNTSLYKYLAIINEANISEIILGVVYDNFIDNTTNFLKNTGERAIDTYKNEMRQPYQKYVEKILRNGWRGIKNNLLVSSFTTFEFFLNHIVTVYCKCFSKLYSDESVKISFSIIKDFSTEEEIRDYFIKTHLETFSAFPFNEKIHYIKKTLKLREDDIWLLNGKEYIHDINIIKNKIVHSEEISEIFDDEFYMYINYLCSIIFRLSVYSQIKYGIEFEWINNTNLHFRIADKRDG
ncbi:MAG: hypothetical protein LBP71_06970 [Spirochaetaceae bacterium]|nr:hypothetical protein [Spirochaetaceae bacterium]